MGTGRLESHNGYHSMTLLWLCPRQLLENSGTLEPAPSTPNSMSEATARCEKRETIGNASLTAELIEKLWVLVSKTSLGQVVALPFYSSAVSRELRKNGCSINGGADISWRLR